MVPLAVFVLLFIAVAEATFWLEFSTRFNFIAVDYLLYTHEVLGNIRESYPVPWIVAGIAAAAMLDRARRCALRSAAPISRRRRVPAGSDTSPPSLVLPAAALAVASIEQMGSIGNAYADELAGNGIFTFAAAARRNELDYDKLYATMTAGRGGPAAEVARRRAQAAPADSRSITWPAHEGAEPHTPARRAARATSCS